MPSSDNGFEGRVCADIDGSNREVASAPWYDSHGGDVGQQVLWHILQGLRTSTSQVGNVSFMLLNLKGPI